MADYTSINSFVSNINLFLAFSDLIDAKVWNVVMMYLSKAIDKFVPKFKNEKIERIPKHIK